MKSDINFFNVLWINEIILSFKIIILNQARSPSNEISFENWTHRSETFKPT